MVPQVQSSLLVCLYKFPNSSDLVNNYSLDAQEKLGDEYALKHNLKIVKCWKVSESAWKDERKNFNEMINYSKKHDSIKHIIFDATDRMTRNDIDKIKINTLIKYHDKKVHFSRSNKAFDKFSSSEDMFMLDIEVAVAKKMSNDISRRAKMGMQEKAEQGIYPSHAPLGYENNPITRLIDVDEEIAPYVVRAFSLIASGAYSLQMVAVILYNEGLRSKKGASIWVSCIYKMLKNPIYYGVIRWNGKLYKGTLVPLISKELFDKA